MVTRRKGRGKAAGNGNNNDREFRGSDQVRTALIRGNTFAAKSVQYSEIDGLAIFEGDIVLGTVQQVEQMSDMLRAEMKGGVAAGVLITGAQFRWPNCRIPFTIDPALPNQARVTDAIAHWESNTSFRFIARTTETDFVTFRPGSGCSSSVGRQGGQQFVNLAAGCTTGNAIHEIGHVIGLWHEQSREDRDAFVRINWDKIIPGREHNFNQHITDGDDVGAYDYGSIMHYPRDAFSVDGSDTITPIAAVPPGTTIGQRTALSPGDIAAANSMCAPKPLKEGPKDPIKEIRKEVLKEIPRDTRKELIKDIRFDTRKEMIFDTLKEQIRDTFKEGPLDPGPTIQELPITPGRPPVLPPGPVAPMPGGARPFVVVTPQPGTAEPSGAAAGLQDEIAQLDAQLQQLADQLAQLDQAKESLQAQYNETSALLAQLMKEYDRSAG
jgi:hypothetical protein